MVALASPAGCVRLLCFHREVRTLQLYLSHVCYVLRLVHLLKKKKMASFDQIHPLRRLILSVKHGQYVFRLPPSVWLQIRW